MATIFPGSASVGQIFDGYEFNGTSWDIIGIDLTANYPEILEGKISASVIPDIFATNEYVDQEVGNIDLSPYLTQSSASSTYITQASASTTYATKSYADNSASVAAAAIVDAAPETLNTLNELAAALGDDANFATTVTNSLSNKLDISSASSTYLTQVDASNTYATTSYPIISDASLTGTSIVEQVVETVTISQTSASGTINYDVLDKHGVMYYTDAATGNWTLNVRWNEANPVYENLGIGNSITIVFINTNTTNAYYQTGFKIDNVSVTPKWQGGIAPSSGNSNSKDVYSFTIIRTGISTYDVLASQNKFS
jgi:hypothetical protein